MVTTTTVYSFQKPDVSGDEDAWGGYLNANIDKYESILTGNTTITSLVITTADINGGTLDNVVIGGSTAAAVTGTTITGTGFVSTGNMTFGDNNKAIFGAGSDLQIYHDGSNSYMLEGGTGSLIVGGTNLYLANGDNSKAFLRGTNNADVALYYNNSIKLATTSTGIDVTGTVTADGLTVDGGTGNYGIEIEARTDFTGISGQLAVTDSTGSAIFNTVSGSLNISTGATFGTNTGTQRLQIGSGGDISFYEDTGTTAKFFWDASAESLGVGTTAPTNTIEIHDADTSNTIGGSTASMHIVNTDTSAYGRTADLNFDVGATTNPLAAVSGVYTLYDGGTEGALVMSTSNSGSLAERLRITSDGNVGIGVTSPSSYNAAANNLVISDGGNAGITIVSPSTDSGSLFFADGTSGTAAYAGFVQYGHAAEKLILGTGGTTKVTIDGNGNVGIGTADPASFASYRYLDVAGASSSQGGVIQVYTSGKETRSQWFADSTGVHLKAVTNHSLSFHTNATERMTIDTSGNLLVGKTSGALGTAGSVFYNYGLIESVRDGNKVMTLNRLTSDGDIIDFRKDGTTVGSIGCNGPQLFIMGRSTDSGIFFGTNNIYPFRTSGVSDDTIDIGHPSYRFDDIYATNGTIQTSDRNEKQDIAELTDAEQRVAVAAKGLLRKFRWKTAVAEKGDEARTHFGIIAQDLQAAFAAEGLDASDYAMFISTTWTDEETGEERTRMGVRYSELLAFIIAAI